MIVQMHQMVPTRSASSNPARAANGEELKNKSNPCSKRIFHTSTKRSVFSRQFHLHKRRSMSKDDSNSRRTHCLSHLKSSCQFLSPDLSVSLETPSLRGRIRSHRIDRNSIQNKTKNYKRVLTIPFAADDESFPSAPSALSTVSSTRKYGGSDENNSDSGTSSSAVQQFLFPPAESLPDEVYMSFGDHLEELRERLLLSVLSLGICAAGCFCVAKELVLVLEYPALGSGVRFLQLSPGEFFFTSVQVAGYSGLLLSFPLICFQVAQYVGPGLTIREREVVFPLVASSSVLFYLGAMFGNWCLAPAALQFFVSYGDGAVESLWSIEQYFSFLLVLLFSTGLAFQVPVVQVLLGKAGVVRSSDMASVWRYVVVGSTVMAAVLTPSTDPFTQALLAVPLVGLYAMGVVVVYLMEKQSEEEMQNLG